MVNPILSWERVKGRCGYVYKHLVMIADHLDVLYPEALEGGGASDWVKVHVNTLSNI